ncbi:type II secretion system F family protein [Thomasclavelia sp.]|uniref:type II secretion system F family protein n=1 Tax=Thomasclavelia sp. TaxID=3025757 RepID=UPI0025F33548|nr:type II secretion system F family protein [Thomasclavelia sp.]
MKLTVSEKYIFCLQMAMILNSGFSLHQGITMINEEIDNKNIKTVLDQLTTYLDDQYSFSEAIEKSQAFDDYMNNLISVGEASGNLDEVMKSLSEYYYRIDDITSKLKQALTFPLILLIMMVVVVGVIVFKVLPVFQNVLRNLGSDLSAFANTFMEFGQIFSLGCFIVLAIIVVIIIISYLYSRIKHINVLTNFVQKSFLTKKLSNALNKAQITYALSLFVASGYDLQEAMKFVPKLVDDVKLQKQLEKCNQDLEAGDDFVTVIKRYQIYQGMSLNMIQVGFKTGQIDQVMTKLANQFQEEVSEAISRFLNIIEPSIVALLSLVVGIILLSVMLPLISIMSSL